MGVCLRVCVDIKKDDEELLQRTATDKGWKTINKPAAATTTTTGDCEKKTSPLRVIIEHIHTNTRIYMYTVCT